MLLALVGPTGSGKTDAAVQIGETLGVEVISVDSMLVYRGMDIGTAKPTEAQRDRVKHHLLDLAEPSERFTVAMYQRAAREALADLAARGVGGLAVGGSGLYYRALVDDLSFPPEDAPTRDLLDRDVSAGLPRVYARLAELDPVAASKIEPANARRIVRALEVPALTGRTFSSFADDWERYPTENVRVAGIRFPGDVLEARIRTRVASQVASGFVDEVRGLVDRGWGDWLTATQAIGYAEMARHLRGEVPLGAAIETIVVRTKRLARRQMAWFRRDPRVRWFEAGDEGAAGLTDRLLSFLGG